MISGGSLVPLPPPTARTAAPTSAPAPRIIVSITSRGEIFVAGTPIADGALPAKLRELASRNKDTELMIAADKAVPYARVLFVLDHARQAGLTRISFAVAL